LKKFSVLVLAVVLSGCVPNPSNRKLKMSLFVGIDVSGSFYNSGQFDNAKHLVPAGGSSQVRGDEKSSPSQVYFEGMDPPSLNAGELSFMGHLL